MVIPMTRVEGLEEACIDPSLGGVGISGGHGTGKTTLARSLRGVLPKIEVVENSICNCDPSKPSEWDVLSRERLVKDDKGEVKTKVIDCPFIELPLGCTEDRLDDLVSLLLTAVESGVNRVEREGLSVALLSGPLRPHLLDRLAISLNTDVATVYTDLDERVSAALSAIDFAERPSQSLEESAADITAMQTQLLFAREFLNDVGILVFQRHLFAFSTKLLFRSRSLKNRWDALPRKPVEVAAKVTAVRCLPSRSPVLMLRFKACICKLGRLKKNFAPRIRVQEAQMQEEIEEEEEPPPPPPPPPQPDQEDPEEHTPPPEQDEYEEEEQEEEEEPDEDQDQEDQDPDVPEEFMIDPEGAVVDPDLLKFQQKQKKSGRSGKGNKIYSMDRGRYVKAMLPKGGDTKSGKIALDATLRNAVVYQKMRREEAAKKLKPEDLSRAASTGFIQLSVN
eukprot:g16059.t1